MTEEQRRIQTASCYAFHNAKVWRLLDKQQEMYEAWDQAIQRRLFVFGTRSAASEGLQSAVSKDGNAMAVYSSEQAARAAAAEAELAVAQQQLKWLQAKFDTLRAQGWSCTKLSLRMHYGSNTDVRCRSIRTLTHRTP